MQFIAKKYLVGLSLIASMFVNLAAQEKNISFKWLDRYEKELVGNIRVNLLPQPGDGLYQLEFFVTWNNQEGNPITETDQMPFLCLSKYDFTFPDQCIKCTSIDPKKPFTLKFRSSEKLNLQVLNRYEGKVKLTALFQYALNDEKFVSGKWEKININGTNKLEMDFVVRSQKEAIEPDISSNTKNQPGLSGNTQAFIRIVAENYLSLNAKVEEFKRKRSYSEISRLNYRQELDSLTLRIEMEKDKLIPDSLPSDTLTLYQNRYNRLSDAVSDLTTFYLKYRVSQSDQATNSDLSNQLRKNDSLRNIIRINLQPVFQNLVDSVNRLAEDQKLVALEISKILSDPKSRKQHDQEVDSLVRSHGQIKNKLVNLGRNHDDARKSYNVDIDSLMPLREIEALDITFLDKQKNLQSAIDQFDREIVTFETNQGEAPWYMSNRLLWTGLLTLLVLVFASGIWSTSRNRRILKEQLSMLETGNSVTNNGKTLVTGKFTNELAEEYFTAEYEISIPESVVGKIHYHPSAIKTVYHLIQGALQERRSSDFGGYLFGNQYKLPGKGTVKSEIFIDKACDSKYLRSSISNDPSARADLIDELDDLVRQNKKYRLIGWFTSCADNSMEIPEGLMKIHRSFFKDKWQIGLIINPGSEVLQGAGFLRRKTGYLDPMPDPASFVKWDELYRFALNPSSSIKNGSDLHNKKGQKYSRIALNNTWGDSIVSAVNFDLSVVGEITTAASGQAIPKDTYQVVGYLYGTAEAMPTAEGKVNEYEVFISRFIELSNELTPRDLPGLALIGWWGQAHVDVINYLQEAVDYHEKTFREAYQISCLVNPSTSEFRIFTRKHSLEMNNNIIETEEYSLKDLLSG
jgi:hypothetical protein